MIASVSRAIHTAAGCPPMSGDLPGRCRLCGLDGVGVPFAAWVKDTFTDHDKMQPGTVICQACQFCASEATPGLAERVGKVKAQKFRNYSHFVVSGVWYPLSKADKTRMRQILAAKPAVALIAVSGQKHLFFRALPGWWQIEDQAMRPDASGLGALIEPIERLYRAGLSKAEIESGNYQQQRVLRAGLLLWRNAEAQIRHARGSLVFALAVFLAQQEDTSGA